MFSLPFFEGNDASLSRAGWRQLAVSLRTQRGADAPFTLHYSLLSKSLALSFELSHLSLCTRMLSANGKDSQLILKRIESSLNSVYMRVWRGQSASSQFRCFACTGKHMTVDRSAHTHTSAPISGKSRIDAWALQVMRQCTAQSLSLSPQGSAPRQARRAHCQALDQYSESTARHCRRGPGITQGSEATVFS